MEKKGLGCFTEQMNIDLLGEIPLVQSVREALDIGRPGFYKDLQKSQLLSDLAKKVVQNIDKRNNELEKTKFVELTNKVWLFYKIIYYGYNYR